MIRLQVEFDRPDRCYRFGDEISGRVTISAESDVECSEIWITYRWRTHGRGFRDIGYGDELILASAVTPIHAGEHKQFSFGFTAPNGPVTYHGHDLNVDWYAIAHAAIASGGSIECEEDFLLLGGDAVGEFILGDSEVFAGDLPARTPGEAPRSPRMLETKPGRTNAIWSFLRAALPLLIVVIIFLLGVSQSLVSTAAAFLISVVAAILGYRLFVYSGRAFRNAYARKLEAAELRVTPATVFAGGWIGCHAEFRARGEVHCRGIKASVRAQERVRSLIGTTPSTSYHIVAERAFVRSLDEHLLAGRWISIDCSIPLAADAPPTFSSKNNALDWSIRLQVDLKGWPDWSETFELTVLP